MNFYILTTGRKVPPFEGDIGDLPVCRMSIRRWQETAASQLGMEAIHLSMKDSPMVDSDSIMIQDSLFVTPSFLKKFIDGVRKKEEAILCAGVRASKWTEITVPLQRLFKREEGGEIYHLFPLFRVRRGARLEWNGAIPFLPMDIKGIEWGFDRDGMRGLTTLKVPLTMDMAIDIRHWIHLLKANLLGLYPSLIEGFSSGGARKILRLLKAMLLTRDFKNPIAWAERMNIKGRGVKIHRSAVVEGSVLGDGVKVGANSTVRFSILADGVEIEENSLVSFSVLCEKSRVLRLGGVKFSLLLPGSSVGAGIQLCIVGRGARVKYGSYLFDSSFSGEVRVRDGEDLVPAGDFPVGCCVGDRAVIGSGVFVPAGRAIPPGVVVVKGEGLLLRLPASLPEGTIINEKGEVISEDNHDRGER